MTGFPLHQGADGTRRATAGAAALRRRELS